jgi:hypothetical protein
MLIQAGSHIALPVSLSEQRQPRNTCDYQSVARRR